jgi:hypothetical protein
MRNHMRVHESDDIRLQECNICHRTYRNKSAFREHMRSHSGKQSICDQCGKFYTTASSLRVSNYFLHQFHEEKYRYRAVCLENNTNLKKMRQYSNILEGMGGAQLKIGSAQS